MDVSQFLKSFKKNVSAKAKSVSGTGLNAATTDAIETEELSDLLHSDSDHEAEGQPSDYVVGGRSDRVAGKRYGAHQKRNQEFEALKVFGNNASSAVEPGRLHRQRPIVAQQLKDSRKRPREELVASVRAELLRQRDQLQSARAAALAEVAAEAPVAQVEATMLQVEDLLSSQSAEQPAKAVSSAALLDFLPSASISSAAPQEAKVGPSRPLPDSTTVDSPSAVAGPPSVSSPPSRAAGVAPATEKVVPSLAKKRSKFEMAMALAKAGEDE
ncbi:hypothetical protein ABL78_6719 [Leptomonas seymouri]|uniref:Uncharacterized protein n=1 Tax=Leptomonas seymouri TaxID=5684 RepID=A0A0N1PCS9_LEPSE|nr:hypothetical protein ABL78_6719 [Leptomonas seymouri]|eukprot:KPI84233.1 hypothetical protein ABL78_6719 [Leptomonas seymouri]